MSSLIKFVGQELPEYKGKNDSVIFDINDDGGMLVIALNHPTNEEIQEFYSSNVRIRAALLSNVTWLTFKFGELDWMDAPFSLHLSKLSNKEQLYNYCKKIRVVLIDTETGRVMLLCEIILTDDFSKKVSFLMSNSFVMPFDKNEYDLLLENIKNTFTPNQIAENSVLEYTSND